MIAYIHCNSENKLNCFYSSCHHRFYFLCFLITICIVYFYILHAAIFCKMQMNLNIPSFDEILRKCVYSFRSRFQDSGNSLVNCNVKSSPSLFTKIWAWWSNNLSFFYWNWKIYYKSTKYI